MTATPAAPIATDAGALLTPQTSPNEPQAAPSLKRRTIEGSAWTTGSYVAGQVLRLANTIILTRLVAPDVIGMMVTINVVLQGLQMFSDIGIGPAIIQNKRGDKMPFLNTAWTIQVGRGFALWIVACLLAWPAAAFYDNAALLWFLPVAGFSAVIDGFASTGPVLLHRQLRLARVTLLDLGSYLVTIVAVLVWAWYSPTVWALIGGTLIGDAVRMIASHLVLPGHRNRLQFIRDDALAMIRFGRWIFISTVLTFLVGTLDRILVPKLMGFDRAGIYGYAIMLAVVPPQFIKSMAMHVVFPALSEIVRERPQQLYRRLFLIRVMLMGLAMVALVPLIFAGDHLVHLMYPEKFHDAGWMLQILSLGMVGGLMISSYGSALFALGRTFDCMVLLVTQLILLVGCALAGYGWAGEQGFIIGVAAVEWLNYPILAVMAARARIWQPHVDGVVMLLAAGTALIAFAL